MSESQSWYDAVDGLIDTVEQRDRRIEELEQIIGRLCDAAGFELEFWLESEDGV